MEKDHKYLGLAFFWSYLPSWVDIHTLLKPENILPTGPWLMHTV